MMHLSLTRGVFAATLLGLACEGLAQEFTKADSGWVRLFNGNDFTGFYSRTYGNVQPVRPVASPYTIEYAGTDTATIRVGTTANQGNIGTDDTTFSHYRLRWESKYDAINSNSNSGLTYHVDESAIRMQNNWPRSIEFQGKQSEIGSAFSIQQVAFNTRATGAGQGSNYSPTAAVRLACEIGCNGRWYKGNPLISVATPGAPTVPRWLNFLLIARGADSATHIVNDTVVMALWNIRIFNDSTKATGSTSSGSNSRSNFTPNGPWGKGGLAWQAEGALVRYRRIEVMRFPESTPKDAPFLHRLFLDNPARAIKPQPGSVFNLKWRAIGTIPKVKIEYRIGSGAWQTAVDSVPNTGHYAWTTPASIPDSINMRISSVDYVWPDSTYGGKPVSIYARAARAQGPLFAVKNGEVVIPEASAFDRIEIRNAAGKAVRTLPAGRATVRWDLTDARGTKVGPGLYFLRLTGATASETARVLVD
jgi:hypothetical protein